MLQEVDGERVDEECFSLHVEEVDGEVWMMFSPTNWATKMAKLSDERTLGLDLGDTNSPETAPRPKPSAGTPVKIKKMNR